VKPEEQTNGNAGDLILTWINKSINNQHLQSETISSHSRRDGSPNGPDEQKEHNQRGVEAEKIKYEDTNDICGGIKGSHSVSEFE